MRNGYAEISLQGFMGMVAAVTMIAMLFLGTVVWITTSDRVTAEQPPLLYCRYDATHGKRVWNYESLGQDDIITDADDVFNLSRCTKWSEHVNQKTN